MKKYIYLLLPLLTLHPTLATQELFINTIIASTLVLSHSSYDKKLSLELHKAVEQNNTTNALQLINNPQVDIHAKVDYSKFFDRGCTPLIRCAWQGDKSLKIAQALLGHQHINVNLQTNNGTTPLIKCCIIGDGALQIAQALLGHKDINVNLQDQWDCTPLIRCALTGDDSLRIAQELLGHKNINVNLQELEGCTPLIMCACEGDKSLKIAQALLGHQHINVNLGNNNGSTPLIWCCKKGDDALQIAQALLGHQHINVNLQDKDGCTPLIYCAEKGDKSLSIAQALLGHQNINVNLQDKLGRTPLMFCAYKGDKWLQIAQELLKHQHINVNLQNNDGNTPLIFCAYKGDEALYIAQALLKHKHINVNLQQNDGLTPLDKIIEKIQLCKRHNWKNYKYVQLWNLLVAQGGILNKRKAYYQNFKPSDFNEPHKGYVQAIKNNPPKNLSSKKHPTPTQNHLNKNNPPTNLKLSSLTQENERLTKQLEKLQKTSTQQLDQKNNTINKLKDQTQRLNNQLATANQLKDEQQQTINNQKNTIQHKNKDIRKLKNKTQHLTNQLATAKQLKDKQQQNIQHQIPQDFLSQKYTMQNPLVALLTISDYATSPSKIPNLPLVIKDEEILQNIFQKKYHYTTLSPCKKLNYAVNRKNFGKALKTIRTEIENNHHEEKDKYDGLIFVYNGHGELNTALLSDGRQYLMTTICRIFDNRALDFWLGKPRIIIKLACRGSDKGQSISKNPTTRLQKQTIWHCEAQDFISIYANTEGKIVQQSIDPKNNKGSAFVEAFNELTNFDITFQKDLDQILKMLGNKVRKIMQGTECLEWKTTFFDTLYLTKNNHLNKQLSIQDQNETKEDE